jgi:Asp-tRNA(Asn)/Glu-tRNA(Gln) amidotransferase B subunit
MFSRIATELQGQLNHHQLSFQTTSVSPAQMIELIRAVTDRQISGKTGKSVIEYLIQSKDTRDLKDIIQEKHWSTLHHSSPEKLRVFCDEMLLKHPEKVSSCSTMSIRVYMSLSHLLSANVT